MKVRNVLAAITAASLVTLPVAAQAGTRAEAAMPSAGVRKSTSVKKKEQLGAGFAALGILAAAAAIWGLSETFKDESKSNGAV